MLRTDAVGVSSHITLAQGGGSQMKKVLVVVAFLVLAAACGGGNSRGRPTMKEGTDHAGPILTISNHYMAPADHFDATIDAMAKIGDVQGEHITGTDVSAQYVDLRARLANAEAQLNAMRALLTNAKSINDIIAVQNQIGQITGQIEQLKG